MHRLVLTVAAVLALAFTGSAVAAAGWTPAQAAAKVKATYTTVDQKAYDYASQRGLTAAMAAALHGAKPTSVTCKSAARGRFHCTAVVQGSARIPPDYVLFTATKKLTVLVPFRVLAGWR